MKSENQVKEKDRSIYWGDDSSDLYVHKYWEHGWYDGYYGTRICVKVRRFDTTVREEE